MSKARKPYAKRKQAHEQSDLLSARLIRTPVYKRADTPESIMAENYARNPVSERIRAFVGQRILPNMGEQHRADQFALILQAINTHLGMLAYETGVPLQGALLENDDLYSGYLTRAEALKNQKEENPCLP